jgi:hypothetical protein
MKSATEAGFSVNGGKPGVSGRRENHRVNFRKYVYPGLFQTLIF